VIISVWVLRVGSSEQIGKKKKKPLAGKGVLFSLVGKTPNVRAFVALHLEFHPLFILW
jgi:hypothetical protein